MGALPYTERVAGRVHAVARWTRSRMLLLAGALFALIFILGMGDPRHGGAILFLCVVPIVICAIERGLLGGALGALAGIALTIAWATTSDVEISAAVHLARAVSFMAVGLIVGRFVEASRAAQRRFDRAYEVAVEMHCIAGFDGHFTRVNPAGCALLGYTEEELLARPFFDLVHPEDRAATLREAERLFGGDGCTINFENRYRTADGSYRWLAWTSTAIPDERLVYATARDITDQREQRDVLERLVRERTSGLQAARFENLRRLALVAEYRDDDSHRHTGRVGEMAALLAQALREPTALIEHIRYAAPLHDVGKIGIPDAILLKPGPLTVTERAQMQRHTAIGASILADSEYPVLRLGEEIALTHHERWDGGGYPAGLEGESIPIAGRIVAVADVFDALTHARPYKSAWPIDVALAEIRAGSGTQFDPRVVTAFEELHRRGALEQFVTHTAAGRPTASVPPTERITERSSSLGA